MNIFYNTSQHKSDKRLNNSFITSGTEMFLFFNMMMKQMSIYSNREQTRLKNKPKEGRHDVRPLCLLPLNAGEYPVATSYLIIFLPFLIRMPLASLLTRWPARL